MNRQGSDVKLPFVPFLSGFIGVLLFGLVAALFALAAAGKTMPEASSSPASPVTVDLQKIVDSRRLRVAGLDQEVSRLQAEWLEFFGSRARKAIEAQAAVEDRQNAENRFLANPDIHKLIRTTLEEERKREFLRHIADAANEQIQSLETTVPLSSAQEELLREDLNRHLFEFETWRHKMSLYSKHEITEGFRSFSSDYEGMLKRVLTPTQWDTVTKISGGRARYADLIESGELQERVESAQMTPNRNEDERVR